MKSKPIAYLWAWILAILLLFVAVRHYVNNAKPKEGGIYYIDPLTALLAPRLSF